jgi:hypothetical protein
VLGKYRWRQSSVQRAGICQFGPQELCELAQFTVRNKKAAGVSPNGLLDQNLIRWAIPTMVILLRYRFDILNGQAPNEDPHWYVKAADGGR